MKVPPKKEVKAAFLKLEREDPAMFDVFALMIGTMAGLTKQGLAPHGLQENWPMMKRILQQMRADAPKRLRPSIDRLLKVVHSQMPPTRRKSVQ
jgi:hypothetical protein